VYKLSKALYGLKQASWAWYARLKMFLLEHGYVMGSVDKTLITLNHGTDLLIVHIYVDDIIFGGSSHTLVSRFQEMMENEFQMSIVIPRSEIVGTKPPYVCPGCFIHTYSNNMINKFHVQ
jgi:hypothetical protein